MRDQKIGIVPFGQPVLADGDGSRPGMLGQFRAVEHGERPGHAAEGKIVEQMDDVDHAAASFR